MECTPLNLGTLDTQRGTVKFHDISLILSMPLQQCFHKLGSNALHQNIGEERTEWGTQSGRSGFLAGPTAGQVAGL